MLGKLVRWLRFSGYDVEYSNKYADVELLKKTSFSERILLTRDLELFNRAKKMGIKTVLIESGQLVDQLVQLKGHFGINLKENPEESLCPVCNGKIVSIEKGRVKGKVPEGVFENIPQFYKCVSCKKIYWEGTHWENIKRIVQKIENDVQYSERGAGD